MRAHDAVVVGSGAAGGWAAKELCEGGLDVLLLEAGRPIDPAMDFPVPAPAERPLASRAAAALRGQRVQLRCARFNARTRRFFVSDRAHPYTTPRGTPFNWFRGRQVGGRLHVWGRVVHRLSDRELADWPLTYDDLAPYYDEVEALMGVRRVALTPAEERFRSAIEGSASVERARLAARDLGSAPAPLRAALETGRLTLRADAVVRRVVRDPRTGKGSAVEFVDRRTRVAHRAPAGVVVLCASTIETLRILLGSGLRDGSGRLGRFLMDHVMAGIGGPLEERRGGAEPLDAYDFGADTGFIVPRDGYAIQGGIGRGGSAWYMLAHGAMLARRENRVTLHPRATDAWGAHVAHIACAHSPREAALAAGQLEAMRELAARAGLTVRTPPSGRRLQAIAFRVARPLLLSPSGAFLPGSAAHEIGGAAIGDDPGASVADPWGRLWEADNVVVADGAAFPTGCWQNVTLTIAALALRAARHVVEEHRAARV